MIFDMSAQLGRRVWTIGGLSLIALVVALAGPGPSAPGDGAAVGRLLGGESPVIEGESFAWVWPGRVAESSSFDWHPAVFLARGAPGEPRDLFVADFRVTADGRPREGRRLTNLSRSADGDERALAAAGDGRVAFATETAGRFSSINMVDFAGEPAALTAGWSRGWRIANQITNFQRTGRTTGLNWRNYVLLEPAVEIGLVFAARGGPAVLEVTTSTGTFDIDERGGAESAAVVVQEMVKGRPALLAWAVDTVRAIPWIGRRKIEWLEKVWFDFSDWLARTRYDLLGVTEELPPLDARAALVGGAETGLPDWPPPDIAPRIPGAEDGEGVWLPVDDGLATPSAPGPPLFYQTFYRVDPERPFARIHMNTWDPARVGLRMIAGVQEPQSTTGLRGTGEVPRGGPEGDDIARLVGAFNGAFQALHGEWGMVLDRRVLLPPRAYGATVAVDDDGSVSLGTWPHPVGELPPEMRDLRQNVNPLVENKRVNPYQRKWWGGVPQGVEERVFTVRSGVCLTFAGKLVYLWGDHQSPETLADGMLAAGCDYGIHLDMNAGHCGFEYYRVDPAGAEPALGRGLRRGYEAEGPVPRRDDLHFRARKMVPKMGHMRFPRYIGRDPRDFFYLIRLDSIYDDPPPEADGGWTPSGAREGFPVPIVTAELPGDRRLFKIDPRQVEVGVVEREPEDALIAVPFVTGARGIATGLTVDGREISPLQGGEPGIALVAERVVLLEPGQPPPGDTLVQGIPPAVGGMVDVRHGLAVDARGHLLVAEGGGGAGGLVEALGAVGADRALLLIAPTGGPGERTFWLTFRARGRRAWKRIFTDVEPVPPSVWREVFWQRGRLLDHDNRDE